MKKRERDKEGVVEFIAFCLFLHRSKKPPKGKRNGIWYSFKIIINQTYGGKFLYENKY